MKTIGIYTVFLLLLLSLTVLLNRYWVSVFEMKWGFAFLLIKTYVLTDAIACFSLFLFYIKSAYRSSLMIILICFICFVLVSVLRFLGGWITIWYSHSPEVIVFYRQNGIQLNLANMLVAFVISSFTALVLMVIKPKISAGPR